MTDRLPTTAQRADPGEPSGAAAGSTRIGGLGLIHRAIAGLALLALMRLAAPLLIPVASAGVLWLLFSPVADALERRGVPALLGAAVVAFLPPALLGAALLLSLPATMDAVDAASASTRHLVDLIAPVAGRGGAPGAAARWLASHLAWNGDAVADWAQSRAPEAALAAVSTLMLLFFLLLAQRSLGRSVMGAVSDRADRDRLLGGIREARRGVVAFVGVMGAMNAALALATGVALAAIGLPHAAFWAVLCFVLVFVPYLGPLAVAVLLLVAGSEGFGPGPTMFAPAAAFLALHAVEANFLSPWLMGHRLSLGRPALLLSVMTGAWVWGVAGGLLGVPLLIVAAAVVRRLPGARWSAALLAAEDREAAPLPLPNATVLPLRPVRSPGQERRLPDTARTPHPMRIAFVTETYPPEINGVALTVARAVAHLRAQGHDVDLIRPRQPGEQRGSDTAEGEWRSSGYPIPVYPAMRFGLAWPGTLAERFRRSGVQLVQSRPKVRSAGRRCRRRTASACRSPPTSGPTSTSTASITVWAGSSR